MLKIIKLGIVVLSCLATVACANHSGMREQFEKSVKDYNRLLRWHEIPAAGVHYMVPEQRKAFMAAAEKINTKDLSITDYRILTMECRTEKESGSAVVEFDYFILPSNRLKTLTYTQEWTYLDSGGAKSWKVQSVLPAFR